MIKRLLEEAATIINSGFKLIENKDGFSFYKKVIGDNKRFLIVCETTHLESVGYYNNTIQDIVPHEIKNDPAFERNSDLIILFKVSNLGDFNINEQKIFSIEEDPYYFKKYVLYYSEEELKLVEHKTLTDLQSIVLNRSLFKTYKKNPNYPSLYSFSARFFIKIPFLQVPVNEEEMPSVEVMLRESLLESNLVEFDSHLTNIINNNDGDHTEILKEFENE